MQPWLTAGPATEKPNHLIAVAWLAIGITALAFPLFSPTGTRGAHAQGIPPQITISPKVRTSAVHKDADDCAIWVHPTDPSKSTVIGTDKGRSHGGLFVWNLNGQRIQYIQLNAPNNVDVRQAMMVGGQSIDIAVVNVVRSKEIKVYKIDPTTRLLEDITTRGGIKTPELRSPYGLCLYRRPRDGTVFVITSTRSGDKKNLHQYRLADDGTGKVGGGYVRALGNHSIRNVVEGLVADDELGYVYAADQSRAVRKYYADPDLGNGSPIVAFGTDDGIAGDREGLALYACADGTGYLLLSSQGNSTVKVYRREGEAGDPHKHLLLTTIKTRGASQTDGLDVTNRPAAPNFPKGFLAKHNSPGRNFGLYAWEDIAQGFLTTCPDRRQD